jgi:tRNA threonylcarbamoyl adenosine modification protein (Sua5/YciO/YrdC/YwlC family)
VLLKIYPQNPNPRHILTVVECLRDGGVIIFPTDTVYALGCDVTKIKAAERIASIKGKALGKSHFSFVCYDLSHISDYTKQIDTATFKLMKKALPGPYTFILNASHNVPSRYFGPKSHKKTIGIRIPDNSISREIVRELNNPLMSTSIRDEDEILEYSTDPELIYEKFRDKVDIVIDGGYGGNEPSTVIDCTGDAPEVIREGKGNAYEIL